MEMDDFKVVLLGVVYNPEKKEILIVRREKDPIIPKLTWCFPGGRLGYNEEVDKSLKNSIKEKTGYTVKNLGAIFSDVAKEKDDLLKVYYLCEVLEGKGKAEGKKIKELKWVKPAEIEKHFQTSFNTRLKEYISNLI